MFAMPISIAQFVKRATRPTLTKNCEEDITIDKYLHTIGVIVDDESTMESKYMGKRFHASVSKVKEKEASDIENLTHLLKSLTTEVAELKQWTS